MTPLPWSPALPPVAPPARAVSALAHSPLELSSLALSVLVAALVAGAVLVWPVAPTPPPRPQPGGPAGDSVRRGGRSHRYLLDRLRARRPVGRSGVDEVQLLDGLAAALEAGLPTDQAVGMALETVTPDGAGGSAAWADLARAAGEGQLLAPAWARVARRTGSPTAATVSRAWTVAAATGAPVAAAVRTSAHAARERRRLVRVVEVATAGARATATVLGMLPVAGVGLAALLGVGPVTLYSHPLALASAGLGLVLLVVGHLLVRRMVGHVLAGVS